MKHPHKAALLSFAFTALAATFASPQTPTQSDKVATESVRNDFKFDVVSVRPVPTGGLAPLPGFTPNGFNGQLSVRLMILFCYAPEEFPASLNPNGATRISNPPNWIDDFYEINARVADADLQRWRNDSASRELYKSGLQDILRDRFKLAIHQQPTEVAGYRLVTKGKSLKLKETPTGFVFPPGRPLTGGGVATSAGGKSRGWHSYGATMENLAALLSLTTGLPVEDSTGLNSHYEFVIEPTDGHSQDTDDPVNGWSIDQLGLALKLGKIPGRVLIIDHIEKPDAN